MISHCPNHGIKARFAQGTYRRLGRKIGYRRRSRFCSELAVHETGPVRCFARVLHRGSRVAVAEASLKDAAGRTYAHATSTLLITTS